MNQNQDKAKANRKRLTTGLIKLVKPPEMTIDAYKVACNLNGIDADVENGPYLHWLMTAQDSDESYVGLDVRKRILKALDSGYLLDPGNEIQQSYFFDGIVDTIGQDLDYTTALIKGVFKHFKSGKLFDQVRELNKSFGFVSDFYFPGKCRSLAEAIAEDMVS